MKNLGRACNDMFKVYKLATIFKHQYFINLISEN